MICGKTRPKYEWAQIIGHVAATHGHKSRGKNERWGIPEKEKYQIAEEGKKGENGEIDEILAFEMKLKE